MPKIQGELNAIFDADTGEVTALVRRDGRDTEQALGAGGAAQFPLPSPSVGGDERGILALQNPTTYDAAGVKFNFSVVSTDTAFLDWNSNPYFDSIYTFGPNSNAYGGRDDATKASFSTTFETKFWLAGTRNVFAYEYGFRLFSDSGSEFRYFDSYMPYDGLGATARLYFDKLDFGNLDTLGGGSRLFAQFQMSSERRVVVFPAGAQTAGATAAGATTNAAGYAVGAAQVTLAAAGAGNLPAGGAFRFGGTGAIYTATETRNNVNAGGVLKFHPPLQATIPAAATAITLVSSLPSATMEFGTNNAPVFYQQNAAGNAQLGFPYYDAADVFTLPLGRAFGANAVGQPLLFRGKAAMNSAYVEFQTETGAAVARIGGYNNSGSGLGRGWIQANSVDESSGFEANYNLGGRGVQVTMQAEGGYGASTGWIRLLSSGTGASTAKLNVMVPASTNDIVLGTYPATARLTLGGAVNSSGLPFRLASYANVAALPSAATMGAGALCYVAATTTPGGACIVTSDGAAWKVTTQLSAAATVA